ncbi:MAG: class I adenylate-forming enzyme family protein [Pseudomonadota bacterium]
MTLNLSFTGETQTSAAIRLRYADDPELGGGNVLMVAAANNPHPDLPFLITETPLTDIDGTAKSQFSLAELDGLAQAWSVWYLEHGIRPRDRIAVYIDDGFEDVLQFFALSQIGAIAVLINGNMAPELAADLCRRTGVVGLYSDAGHVERLDEHLGEYGARLRMKVINSEIGAIGPRRLSSDRCYRHAADDPVYICHSSGTTGAPKAVIWTHRQSIEGIRWLLRASGAGRMSLLPRKATGPADNKTHPQVLLSAVPQSHSAGMSFAAGPLLFGAPLIALSDVSGGNVIAAIERYQPTEVVAFSATYAEIAALAPDSHRLASVGTGVNTGDSIHARHMQPLVNAGHRWIDGELKPGSEFIDGLGSSELGFAQFLKVTTADSLRHDRCVGKRHAFAEPAVLRKDGTPAEPYEPGLLGVKSPTVTPGYWNDSDATYRSRIGEYWLSGDVVYRDDSDLYYHMDRAVDVINTPNGPAYSLLMEEILLAQLPEISECAVVAAPFGEAELPVAIAVRCGDVVVDAHQLLDRANSILRSHSQQELAFLEIAATPRSIPLGPTGKVLKRVLRKRYEGMLAAHADHAAPVSVHAYAGIVATASQKVAR